MNAIALIEAAGSEILEDFGNSMEIANHSRFDAEWLMLEEMADPEKAFNNCYVVSTEVNEFVPFGDYIEDAKASIVGLTGKPGCHYANHVVLNDQEVVIDFTARQFDENVRFPLVMPFAEWRTFIEDYYEQTMELEIMPNLH